MTVLWLETKTTRQDNKTRQQDKTRQDNNLAELEASLAPAEAEFGAVAKADQHDNRLFMKASYTVHILSYLIR